MTPRPADRKIVGRALVTGGAIRVGRAIALALADAGFDVAIAFHRSAAEARRTVEELRRRGVKAIAIRADLRDARAARTLVAEAARAGCGLDVLVNSAALFEKTPLASATRARWDELIALNLRAAFFCTQAAAARMIDGGHVVNVSDVITRAPRPGWAAYTASKAGEVALRITRGDGPTDYPSTSARRAVVDVEALVMEVQTRDVLQLHRECEVTGGDGLTAAVTHADHAVAGTNSQPSWAW